MMSEPEADNDPAQLLANLASSFDHAPWAVTELSGEAHIVRYANSAFCQLIGKARDEVNGTAFAGLLPASDACQALLERVFRTGVAESYTADEQVSPRPLLFSYHLWPVKSDGRTAGVMVQVHESGPLHETRLAVSQALLLGALRQEALIEAADLANRRLQNEIRERLQREIDARLLANEVAHRVKNNLQVVAALIGMEIRRTPEPWVRGYQATRGRIAAIAQLYDLMAQPTVEGIVTLGDFLNRIADALRASILSPTSGIRLIVEAEAIEIDPKRVVPFGLLVNELCTNAIKHAFPAGSGLVTLAVRRVENEVELSVTDDGIGISPKIEVVHSGKHGSDYVAIFARQLEGVVERSSTPGFGTTFKIRFPLLPESEPSPRP